MRYLVNITETTFLSKSMILLRMEQREEEPISNTDPVARAQRGPSILIGTCQIPWMIRMFHWLSRSGLVPLKDGVIEVRSLNRIPAIVNITSGMVIEEINLLLEREFPGKDLLTAWIVMES